MTAYTNDLPTFIVEGSPLDRENWLPNSLIGDLTLEMARITRENLKAGRENFRAKMKEKYDEDHQSLRYRIVKVSKIKEVVE